MPTLTTDERAVLDAISRLAPNAYGVTIYEALGERLSFGRIYIILHSLAADGLITLNSGDPTPERGGRPKLFAQLSAEIKKP